MRFSPLLGKPNIKANPPQKKIKHTASGCQVYLRLRSLLAREPANMVFYQQVRYVLSGCAVLLGAANASLYTAFICKPLEKRESVVPTTRKHVVLYDKKKHQSTQTRSRHASRAQTLAKRGTPCGPSWYGHRRCHSILSPRIRAVQAPAPNFKYSSTTCTVPGSRQHTFNVLL